MPDVEEEDEAAFRDEEAGKKHEDDEEDADDAAGAAGVVPSFLSGAFCSMHNTPDFSFRMLVMGSSSS